jgi:hypothetical protein
MSAVEMMWYREAIQSREAIDEKDLPESERERRIDVKKEKPSQQH